jgi:hypothetical protein
MDRQSLAPKLLTGTPPPHASFFKYLRKKNYKKFKNLMKKNMKILSRLKFQSAGLMAEDNRT